MVRFSLRLPDEVYKALKDLAEREHRSIHAQILHILICWLDQYGKSK
jgi:hypothetical protein